MYPHTQSAGTAEIARHSGGDAMPVDDASALETTLERIRQRYALHFYMPSDSKAGQNPRIEVALADTARSRYPDADVRYRRVTMSGTPPSGPYQNAGSTGGRDSESVVVGSAPSNASGASSESTADRGNVARRRRAVSDSTGPRGPSPDGNGDAKSADQSDAATKDTDNSKHGGWRRVKPPDQP